MQLLLISIIVCSVQIALISSAVSQFSILECNSFETFWNTSGGICDAYWFSISSTFWYALTKLSIRASSLESSVPLLEAVVSVPLFLAQPLATLVSILLKNSDSSLYPGLPVPVQLSSINAINSYNETTPSFLS